MQAASLAAQSVMAAEILSPMEKLLALAIWKAQAFYADPEWGLLLAYCPVWKLLGSIL